MLTNKGQMDLRYPVNLCTDPANLRERFHYLRCVSARFLVNLASASPEFTISAAKAYYPGNITATKSGRPRPRVADILAGVKADRWRILVGDDAHAFDRLVRADPEAAYEPAFVDKLAAETDLAWIGCSRT